MERQRQAYVYAIFVVMLWATVASAFKLSLGYVDTFQLVLYSSLTSLMILFLILAFQRKLGQVKLCSREDIVRSALLGFLNPFLYYLVLFGAYSLLRAQEAQPLNQTWIILLPLLSIIILGQKIGAKSILALAIGFIGVLIISTQGDILGLRFTNVVGVVLALGSAVIWSLFWIYNVKDDRDEVLKLFLNFSFGFVFILVATIVFSNLAVSDINGILGSLYVGAFEMGITFVLWLKALSLSETIAKVSSLIYLVPFISLVIIHFTVGEDILISTIVGLAFIVAGIIIQQYGGNPKNATTGK